jgi:anti-sigma B factor antagonist
MIAITKREELGALVFELVGRLDAYAAPEVRDALTSAVAEGHTKLVADLTHVSFVDSSGLAALVAGLNRARESGGDLRLACVGEKVCVIFELTHLDATFQITTGLDEAIRSFASNEKD